MRIPRIYYPHSLAIHNTVTLDNATAHYVGHVLRLKNDSLLTIFNNRGGEYQCRIINRRKREIDIAIEKFDAIEKESPLNIHLGQAISRHEKMDWVIQKTTELGIQEITPLFTERCAVKLNEQRWQKRLQHWQSIAISACEQCGRNRLPIIHPPQQLADWVIAQQNELKLILSPHESSSLDIKNNTTIENISLLIGAEGGLSEQEINIAKQQQFQPIQLGSRILRTETAAVTALSILQYQWGDL